MLGISVILAAAALGILYWFFTAPDLRFGASWFWIIGLVVFALGLESMQHIYRLVLLQRIAAILLLSLSALTVAQVGISYVQRAGWGLGNLLYAVPPMPEAKDMQVKRTEQGIPINVVQETRCYWTAPFCTPYFNAKLRIIRAPNGRYTFQVPH